MGNKIGHGFDSMDLLFCVLFSCLLVFSCVLGVSVFRVFFSILLPSQESILLISILIMEHIPQVCQLPSYEALPSY